MGPGLQLAWLAKLSTHKASPPRLGLLCMKATPPRHVRSATAMTTQQMASERHAYGLGHWFEAAPVLALVQHTRQRQSAGQRAPTMLSKASSFLAVSSSRFLLASNSALAGDGSELGSAGTAHTRL